MFNLNITFGIRCGDLKYKGFFFSFFNNYLAICSQGCDRSKCSKPRNKNNTNYTHSGGYLKKNLIFFILYNYSSNISLMKQFFNSLYKIISCDWKFFPIDLCGFSTTNMTKATIFLKFCSTFPTICRFLSPWRGLLLVYLKFLYKMFD